MNILCRPLFTLSLAFFAFGCPSCFAELLTWWKLDEPAGSLVAVDASGNGNDGNLTNFDFSVDSDFDPAGGKYGGAIHFDGLDDHINNTTGFQPTGDFTYAYFFKPDEADYTVGHTRDDHIYCNARPHFSFSRDGGGDGALGMYVNFGGNTNLKSTTTNWSSTDWHFVAWTYDGTEHRIYVNGVLEATAPISGPHTVEGDGRFNLGSNPDNAAASFDGFMDELSIWDETLTEADLVLIANEGVQVLLDAREINVDNDSLPDFFEQPIVDADPNDAIETVHDVLAGDDFDNDGFSNQEEFENRTDPTDPNDPPQPSGRLLFLGGASGPSAGADGAVMTFLQDRYGVENVTYMQSSLATAGDEAGFGGLVISSTPGSDTLRGKFHNSTIPIVNWEEAIADNGAGEFRVTGGRPKDNVATDHVISIREEHPITAGFSVGQEVTISTGQTEVWWSTGQQAPGSVSLGNELEDATRLFLTIVDEGGELNNGTSAPGRRVMLGMTDNTFNNFTEDGRTLAGQAIDWALGITTSAEPIRVTDFTLDPITGNASITWTARPNKFYTVFYTDDLVDLQDGGDVADSLSDGDGTDLDPAEGSYRREFVNPLPASPARFFSVHEDEQ